MSRIFLVPALLLALAGSVAAQDTAPAKTNPAGRQRRAPRPFQLSIVNNSALMLDTIAKTRLRTAFNNVYPAFAQADGYRTKREVKLEVSDAFEGPISAKAGEIIINSNWLKNNPDKLEKALMYQFSKNWVSADTIKKGKYQLVFISKAPEFDPEVKKNLIDTYFKIYPKLVKMFNDSSTRNVLFVVDTAYKGVAEASGNRILFSAAYMKSNPTDIDVVTHETMHIVQGYGYGSGPAWLTEGIADYVRYKFGVDNIGSKWALPEFNDKQSYKNSYRITARFFEWLEQNVKKGLIASLDDQLRKKQYTEQSWANLTGKTIDELWLAYSKSPGLKLKYSGSVKK